MGSPIYVKKVNVYPTSPILTIKPNINSVVFGIELSIPEIKACLYMHAKVEEVFPDGTTVQLDLNNLDKDNEAALLAERKSTEAKIRSQEGTRLALDKANKEIASLNETIKNKDTEISQLTVKLAAVNEDLSKAEAENQSLKAELNTLKNNQNNKKENNKK